MNKQKEIEKMRLSFVNHPCKFDCFNDCQRDTVGSYCMLDKVCKWLYNAGYRLESEVRKETAKEVYEWIKDFMEWDEEGVCRAFAEAYDIEVEE